MVIVEGPDGGGKTTLIKRLTKDTGLPMHARASDSMTGPVQDLYEWTDQDISTWQWQPLSIYDRHPLLSEPIYGPTIRGYVRPGFERSNNALPGYRRYLRENALVILCLPPLDVVTENVHAARDMPGVVENIGYIYDCYQMILSLWPVNAHIARYDYTARAQDANGYDGILASVQDHKYRWKGNHRD